MLIGELARISGLSKDGIRHYEEIGLITSTGRQAGSRLYRDYDERALRTIENIRQAQQLGFTLREIGPLLKTYAERELTEPEAIVFLEERLVVVRDKIARLRDVENFIMRKLDRYKGNTSKT